MVDNQINKINEENQNMPLVSVIVATYRRDISLQKALESLTCQTYGNIEIIVVDDNAEIEWNQKVKTIINKLRLLTSITIKHIVNTKNKGSAETRNIGISQSSGNYVTFLDDDDIYLPNKVKFQIEFMIEKGSDFSLTDLWLYNEDDKLIEKRTRNYIKDFSSDSLRRYHLMYHLTGTDVMMFTKEYLLLIGMFSPINIGDEFYLMLKAIDEKGIFSYLPRCDVKAYVHSKTDGLSSGDGKIKGENELYDFKYKYFNFLKKNERKYIKMRHYAVLAFSELRSQRYFKFAAYSFKSFQSEPIACIKLLLYKI